MELAQLLLECVEFGWADESEIKGIKEENDMLAAQTAEGDFLEIASDGCGCPEFRGIFSYEYGHGRPH